MSPHPALTEKVRRTESEEGWYRAAKRSFVGAFLFSKESFMKPLSGHEIRQRWISFFESKGHKYIPGVSLIPKDDPSLLWVNAGVTGLKKYFDGSEIPPCRRIVNVQKSIRTNDIENVGHTARHHTFFEMLGNFSIGDYFRKEVIAWAKEILTDEEKGFGLPLEKLYATYNPSDLESKKYWIENGFLPDHLIPLEGNYWQIGEGPCGPNTEVFFDRGEKYDPKGLGDRLLREDMENDRYIEIWGIVFSQYNAVNGVPRDQYKELPSKNIDTGAGLERIACVLQGTDTNFETDLFTPIIKEMEKICHKPYEGENLMSYRVIADHARCLTFALGDGASFSNEGRGYVLRRIIRRAMRYGKKLGVHEPFMYKLINVVTDNYKDFYPSLASSLEETSKAVKEEEMKFIRTLESGEALLRERLKEKKDISGKEAFRLYDTYGFPLDLTEEIAAESGLKVDKDGFEKEMEEQRERARNARGEIDSFNKQSKDLMAFDKESVFDYDNDSSVSKVIGLFVDGVSVDEIDNEGDAIFSITPCYAEMGGQVSDKGKIHNDDVNGDILYVGKAPRGQHLHHVKIKKGKLKKGSTITIDIDSNRRRLIERNHSATHLLHAALNEILDGHISQKGSFVNEDYLRFDFSSNRKLTKDEIKSLEKIVNEKIFDGIKEKTEVLPIEKAKEIGAEMEFSEKYGDFVRVVEFSSFSKEFCGGTHVKNTSEIGLFVIESEEAIASGVRRIQARTSSGALNYINSRLSILDKAEEAYNGGDVDLLNKIEKGKNETEELKIENRSLKDKLSSLEAKSISIEEINGISFYGAIKEGESRESLLSLGDTLKANKKDYLFLLLGGEGSTRPFVVLSGGIAKEKCPAGGLIKEAAAILGGGGGGKPDMASGQLKSKEGFDAFLNNVKKRL